jgi:hypothetical protein
MIFLKRLEKWNLAPARRTPCGPEIEQAMFAGPFREVAMCAFEIREFE